MGEVYRAKDQKLGRDVAIKAGYANHLAAREILDQISASRGSPRGDSVECGIALNDAAILRKR